jgi:hypothetical protein
VILERGVLADGRRYAVLEEVGAFCTLGLRFWDAVADAQIREGLQVTAWPLPALRPIRRAFRTVSDVFAFQGLPGLLEIERPAALPGGTPAPGSPASPPIARPFVVEVRDLDRRFLPVAFRVDLPLPTRGVYMPPVVGSPGTLLPGFFLFSSPVRQRQPHVAAVRAELVDLARNAPASWAVVRVSIAGQGDRWGLADEVGRVAVQFPLPLLTPAFGELFSSPSGPASPPGPPVSERSWEISISVLSEPSRLGPLPGTDLPDLAEVFQQGVADVFPLSTSPPTAAPQWTGTLGWDGELFAATAGRHQLFIASFGSP